MRYIYSKKIYIFWLLIFITLGCRFYQSFDVQGLTSFKDLTFQQLGVFLSYGLLFFYMSYLFVFSYFLIRKNDSRINHTLLYIVGFFLISVISFYIQPVQPLDVYLTRGVDKVREKDINQKISDYKKLVAESKDNDSLVRIKMQFKSFPKEFHDYLHQCAEGKLVMRVKLASIFDQKLSIDDVKNFINEKFIITPPVPFNKLSYRHDRLTKPLYREDVMISDHQESPSNHVCVFFMFETLDQKPVAVFY